MGFPALGFFQFLAYMLTEEEMGIERKTKRRGDGKCTWKESSQKFTCLYWFCQSIGSFSPSLQPQSHRVAALAAVILACSEQRHCTAEEQLV